MPMKVRYTVVNGEVIAEKRDGVRYFRVPDPLGSTVALVNGAGVVTDTFRYWPYGEEAARTGTTPTPSGYVGTPGYYHDRLASIYVRKRHYRPDLARWSSADPLGWDGGDLNLYGYVGNRPTVWVDPSGAEMYVMPYCDPCNRMGGHPSFQPIYGGPFSIPERPTGGYPCNKRNACTANYEECVRQGRASGCPPGESAVYVTCFSDAVGTHDHPLGPGSCAVRQDRGRALCPRGSDLYIPGYGGCRVCDKGKGPHKDDKKRTPIWKVPERWLDLWMPSCANADNCWVCVALPKECTGRDTYR